jgi:hypothetical protein
MPIVKPIVFTKSTHYSLLITPYRRNSRRRHLQEGVKRDSEFERHSDPLLEVTGIPLQSFTPSAG